MNLRPVWATYDPVSENNNKIFKKEEEGEEEKYVKGLAPSIHGLLITVCVWRVWRKTSRIMAGMCREAEALTHSQDATREGRDGGPTVFSFNTPSVIQRLPWPTSQLQSSASWAGKMAYCQASDKIWDTFTYNPL